jgi:hypothetical protein
MRDLKDFYVKNKQEEKRIYFRLSPVVFPENDFTYKATKVVTSEEGAEKEEYQLTYKDILNMYEEGFYTIEQHEFERAEALSRLQTADLKE